MVLLKRFVPVVLLSVLFSLSSLAIQFKKELLMVGSKKIQVDVAESSVQQEYGLMNRTKMAENEGMIFVFSDEKTRFFWMKNTLIDLSIAFANSNGEIIDIQEMKAMKKTDTDRSLPTYASAGPAKYALEMNKGWFKKNQIKVGDKIRFVK